MTAQSDKQAGGRPRGRPRSFDLDEVTDVALRLFWEHGYEATSVEAVTAVTGVSASSLYAAFGSKHGLFQAALARYRLWVGAALDALARGSNGLDDVVTFVEWVRAGIASDQQPGGCLIVNSMVELGSSDPELAVVATSHRDQVRASLRAALARAERASEIERRTAAARSLLIEASLFGALATGQAGAPDEADAMLRGVTSEIRRWRVRP